MAMIRVQLRLSKEQKTKLKNESKKAQYGYNSSAVIRDLIDTNL